MPRTVPASSRDTFGMRIDRLVRSRTLRASSCSASKAVTATGTSWSSCSRFWAVTTISSNIAALVAASSSGSASWAVAENGKEPTLSIKVMNRLASWNADA